MFSLPDQGTDNVIVSITVPPCGKGPIPWRPILFFCGCNPQFDLFGVNWLTDCLPVCLPACLPSPAVSGRHVAAAGACCPHAAAGTCCPLPACLPACLPGEKHDDDDDDDDDDDCDDECYDDDDGDDDDDDDCADDDGDDGDDDGDDDFFRAISAGKQVRTSQMWKLTLIILTLRSEKVIRFNWAPIRTYVGPCLLLVRFSYFDCLHSCHNMLRFYRQLHAPLRDNGFR